MTCSFINATDAKTLARNSTLLWTEICAIQQAILNAIDLGYYETFVSDGSPMTQINEIQSITVTNGGTGYFPVAATATVTHPTGVNASLTPIVTNGVVTSFTIVNGGTGYAPVQATINVTGLGNGDAVLQPIVTNGVITSISILNGGTGYVANTSLTPTVVHPYGVSVSASIATVGGSGEILSVNIANGGTGYETIYATVEITHPLHTSPTVVAGYDFVGVTQVTNGVITGVSIQSGGAQYQTLYPTVTITDASGSGAVLTIGAANIAGGIIQSVVVTNGGYGYSTTPVLTVVPAITSAGSNATLTAVVDNNIYGTTSPEYYAVVNGQSTDRVLTDQITFVQDYFTSLGYNIRPLTNNTTGNTIRWYVLW